VPDPECKWTERISSGTKIMGDTVNDQFLDLRYKSALKGQPKHHPLKPPCLSAFFLEGIAPGADRGNNRDNMRKSRANC